DSEDITIDVTTGTNSPPVLDPVSDVTTHPGASLAIQASATDPDGDPVTYSAQNIPAPSTFDDETHSLQWHLTNADIGSYPGIEFDAFDGYDNASETFTINVVPDNPPVLDPIGDKTTHPDATLSFQVTGSDPDGDPLTFNASNLPGGSSFNPSTQ